MPLLIRHSLSNKMLIFGFRKKYPSYQNLDHRDKIREMNQSDTTGS